MQKTETAKTTKNAHRQVQSSTTLNRKYVKRPTKAKKVTKINITHFSEPEEVVKAPEIKEEAIAPAKAHPMQIKVNEKLNERKQAAVVAPAPRPTAKELKEAAIQKALQNAAKQPTLAKTIETKETSTKAKRMKFGVGRIILALSCTAAAIFGIVYFVNLNMPDIQFRAAAIQLNASYPNYVPYNYSPTEIASENNIITINFKNNTKDDSFKIIEEKSSWDSNALLNNYVKLKYGEDYVVLREKGLTIYVSGSDAAWVNGGIVYKLEMKKGSLSKKQITDMAVSF